jgi:hypothetical protein
MATWAAAFAADPQCSADTGPGMVNQYRRLSAVPAALAIAMLAYRLHLAWATSRLAASGAGEEALFALMIDPLWRVELTIARMLGNSGSHTAMNTLGLSLWGGLAAGTSVFAARKIRSKTSPLCVGQTP